LLIAVGKGLLANHLYFIEISWEEKGWGDRRIQQLLISGVTLDRATTTAILATC